MRAAGLVGLALAALVSGPASAEAPGRWVFGDAERPVKAVVIGGSISAYTAGSFSDYLGAVCRRTEIVNRGKARLGAAALERRFEAQVLKNRRLMKAREDYEALWLIFFGGLNSVSSPELTNFHVARTLKKARERGVRTIAVTIGPWGSERDSRWSAERGLEYFDFSQRAVDFILGRSTPAEALGRFAGDRARDGREPDVWAPGELPDVAVDLWDSALRHVDAEPRSRASVERRVRRSAWARRQLAELEGEAREARLEALIVQAMELPRWFMRPELIGFDAIHPNSDGHRVIAEIICPRLPAQLGCDCGRLATASWDRRARAVTFADEAPTAPAK